MKADMPDMDKEYPRLRAWMICLLEHRSVKNTVDQLVTSHRSWIKILLY